MAYQYDFLQDSFKEAPFTVYQSAPTIQLPLMDSPLDISDWAVGVTPSGIPIAKDVNNPVVQESTAESFEIKPPEAQISSGTSVSTSTYSKDYKKDYLVKIDQKKLVNILNYIFMNKYLKKLQIMLIKMY